MATREDYRDAAEEHLKAGIVCHEGDRFVSAHYLFGLAVECILQAHGGIKDSKHNIQRQYESSAYEAIIPENERQTIATALTVVQLRWRSGERYDGPASLTKKLNARRASYNVKGDKLKNNSATMQVAAKTIVELGVKEWS